MNKIDRFLFKYNVNIELLVLGLFFCIALIAIIWDEPDDSSKIFFVLLGSLITVPVLCLALSRNITITKYSAFIFIYVYTPLILFFIARDIIFYKKEGTDILYGIATLLLFILIDVMAYRSYLNINLKREG